MYKIAMDDDFFLKLGGLMKMSVTEYKDSSGTTAYFERGVDESIT